MGQLSGKQFMITCVHLTQHAIPPKIIAQGNSPSLSIGFPKLGANDSGTDRQLLLRPS